MLEGEIIQQFKRWEQKLYVQTKKKLTSRQKNDVKPDGDGSIKIRRKGWDFLQMGATCEKICLWRITDTFNIEQNQEPMILKQISDIKFPDLKVLILSNNHIQSIECLSRIFLPVLQKLVLNKNIISNLTPMKKARLPSLVEFQYASYDHLPSFFTLNMCHLQISKWNFQELQKIILPFKLPKKHKFFYPIFVKINLPKFVHYQSDSQKTWINQPRLRIAQQRVSQLVDDQFLLNRFPYLIKFEVGKQRLQMGNMQIRRRNNNNVNMVRRIPFI